MLFTIPIVDEAIETEVVVPITRDDFIMQKLQEARTSEIQSETRRLARPQREPQDLD